MNSSIADKAQPHSQRARTAFPDATPRHTKSFTEAQSVASRRLGFSVTKACPLRCAHCSVSAAPELSETTMRRDFANKVARQVPGLKAIGIDFFDFTGGEPTLALPFLVEVSRAAAAEGIQCGVVTAAHWARDFDQARAFASKLPHILHWDISTDIHHLPFVSLDQVELAFRVLTDLGRRPLIRIAHQDPMQYEEAVLIDRVSRFAGKSIAFQPIAPVGRGNDLFQLMAVGEAEWDRSPCLTTGPLVMTDGVVAPCCAPVSNENYDHPLRLGNAFHEPLELVVHRWRVHPLLQTLRIWGFEPIVRWLRERGAPHRKMLRHLVCHQCVELLRSSEALSIAVEESSTFAHRIRLAAALQQYFGEPWLDVQLRKEARAMLAEAAVGAP